MAQIKVKPKTRLRVVGLAFIFFISGGIFHLAFGAGPAVEDLRPSSGTSQANQALNFTATYTDPDGWQNIKAVYLLINTTVKGKNSFYGYYDQNNNKLYLRDNANKKWLGDFAPGAAKGIENSYAKLDCAKTRISGSGNKLTVSWSLSFKSTFSGSKNLYLFVIDDTNSKTRWVKKGTWTIQAGPELDTTPPTGTIKINSDQPHTNSTSVTLSLLARDNPGGIGLSQMQFSNDTIIWSAPEAYATTKSWSLPSGDGEKTVYVKYKDAAENWSQVYSDTITLDTTAPNISVNPVSSPTNQNVVLSYSATDNLTPSAQIIITGDNSPYINEGSYNISLSAKDLADNTAAALMSFTIDKTAPLIVITSPAHGAVVDASPIQLQGTVDGISFSEPSTLNPGENVLTKTAADQAGNRASASVRVYFSPPQIIGPEGGEVSSLDGKIKVVIPPGALSQAVPIKIISLNPASFQGAISPETSLLALAECSPFGLIFDKPVQIIYTLSQAEVPGTPVEFVLYDSQQDRLLATGQKAAVQADGYTLSFTITHFLTYGPLKTIISQGAPIGSYVKIPLPDMLTGSFSQAIPLTAIPGRKGMQPGLALSYRSSNSNSWTGLGFSLNPGYIVRSTRLGSPTYNDTTDTFYFITDGGTTELVHLIDNLYQAKIESAFTKFFKEPDDSWKVVGKDGSVLRFGQTTDTKESSISGTFSWYLTKAVDTNGNYISYNYIQDRGKSYLTRIDYTGNENAGTGPTNSVEFTLEPREDILSSYISTSKISTARRLKEILVKQNQELVWRYVLEYIYSSDTHRSLLNSVTQYGSDGKALPTQRMSYQKGK